MSGSTSPSKHTTIVLLTTNIAARQVAAIGTLDLSTTRESLGFIVQVLGKCPTVSIDKTDGCIIYLSKDSLKCEIVSAKSSEMNVAIPPKGGSGDYVSLSV